MNEFGSLALGTTKKNISQTYLDHYYNALQILDSDKIPLVIQPSFVHVGVVPKNHIQNVAFSLYNPTDKTIAVETITTACSCTLLNVTSQLEIAACMEKPIQIAFDTHNKDPGFFREEVLFHLNHIKGYTARFVMQGYIHNGSKE
jgi:hypothetical protein